MGLHLAHQPLVGDSLAERHDDGGRQYAGNGVAYLAETLDVLAQRFAFMLSDGEEIAAGSKQFSEARWLGPGPRGIEPWQHHDM